MEEDNDNNTNINRQQDNKGAEAKGRWVYIFCIFFCLGFCFVVGPFYDNIFVKLKKYISPKI